MANATPDQAGVSTQSSYGQILRATAIIGGSSMMSIILAAVRNKLVAMTLGPAGIGLMGVYNSIADIAITVASAGVPGSAVREIANTEAGGIERTSKTIHTVRRLIWALGGIGALFVFAFSGPIAQATFGDRSQTWGVALIALAVMLRVITSGQVAVLQGARLVRDYAHVTVIAAFLSTLVCLPIIYWMGSEGIALALVAMAAASMLPSWWYTRKLGSKRTDSGLEIAIVCNLLLLGGVFLASAVMTAGAAYMVRVIVVDHYGLTGAGNYQAAWSLGGIYAGFILQAMGTDFYPRLTARANDDEACTRLVNEQAHVGLLLGGPGLLMTLTMASTIIYAMYSSEFAPATGLLRWICLGMMVRIVFWPLGYVVLAKGANRIFLWTEIAATLVHVGLAWLLVPFVGLEGAGAAFFGLYIWHGAIVYFVARRLCGFRWSAENRGTIIMFCGMSALVFMAFRFMPEPYAVGVGLTLSGIGGLYALRRLVRVMPNAATWLPRPIARHLLKSA